jgi:two-component SAPR family response regulator
LQARQEESEPVRLDLLNDFLVLGQTGKPVYWRTKKTKEVFAYLYLNPGPVDRSVLMEAVFPDKDLGSAQALLHTTIYQLRKILSDLGYAKSIRYANEAYSLTINVQSDLAELELLLQQESLTKKQVKGLLQLYKADLLEKEDYFWLAEKRASIRDQTRQALHSFVQGSEQKSNKETIEAALDLLSQIEPLCDITAQAMLDFLGRENRKPQLKSYFEDYQRKLWLELKLKPNQETINLYESYLD